MTDLMLPIGNSPLKKEPLKILNYKKYKNRKIYSLSAKSYVNVTDIITQIRLGNEVSVVDYEGQDITNYTILIALSTDAAKENKLIEKIKEVLREQN